MFSLLAALVVARSPFVTLTIPAARVPVVLEAIGRQIGQKLDADAAMRREVVALRVASAPADQVVSHLAEAVGGEWQTRDGVKTLVVSAAVTQREDNERRAKRSKAIAALLASLTPKGGQKPLDEEMARKEAEAIRLAITEEGPNGLPPFEIPERTLLVSLIRCVPASAYTGAHANERIVFSDAPNSLQYALPASSIEAIDQFRRERALVDRYMTPLINEWRIKVAKRTADEVAAVQPPDEFKVDLAIQFSAEGIDGTPQFLLNIVDSTGHVFSTEKIEADMQSNDDVAAKLPAKTVSPPDTSQIVTPTEDEREFAELLDFSNAAMPAKPKLMAKWRQRIMDPVTYEPAASIGAPLVRAAELRGANLVADIDDIQLIPRWKLEDWSPKPFAAGALAEQVKSWGRVLTTPGWLVIQPQNFGDSRSMRLDRAAVKQLLSRTVEANGMTVEDAAEYAQSTDSMYVLIGWEGEFAHALEAVDGRNGAIHPSDIDAEGLRFYGALSPEERNLLRAGRLRVGDVGPAALAVLNREFYWGDDMAEASKPAYEPTDVLPGGLPPSSLIRIQNESEELLATPVNQINGAVVAASAPRNASAFGMALVGPRAVQLSGERSFRLAHRHSFDINVEYGAGLFGDWMFGEMTYKNEPITAYDDLPQGFRAELEEAKKQRQEELRENAGPAKPPPG